jgi:hypothetical protein
MIDWKHQELCEARANIFKLTNEGPTFRVSLPVGKKLPSYNNNQESINNSNNNDSTEQLPN